MGYLIELKTTQAIAIKIVVDAINSLLTDANFDFYPYYIEDEDKDINDTENLEYDNKEYQKNIGGIVLKEVNKTGKILVYMRLDSDKFDIYKYNSNKKKITLGIDIGNLSKCLKCMSHFDTMLWLVDEDDINKLIIVLESTERKEKKTFKINLMDIDEATYQIDPIQFPYSISLPSQDFHKYCKDMAASTDKIEIKATSNKLIFSGKGEIGNIEFEVGETNGGLSIISTTSNSNEIVQGLFELKFLLIFTKCTNLCNQVILFLKNDYPIIVTYQIAALGEIKLVLSPSKSN
jgi:proliferating cell nuclear antigen|uniref:Proliferating cell nuclear antigen PCNA N-terminal domain-containing protein n=1 Tax=viral metagenome TaxID=1070528 RepID=A0A6C0ECM2_9ZZZZ